MLVSAASTLGWAPWPAAPRGVAPCAVPSGLLLPLLTPRAGPGTWLARLLAGCAALVACWVEPASLTEQYESVIPARWTGPLLRVALISDLHVGAPHCDVEMVERVVAMANQARPDLVLLLGDFGVDDVVGEHWVSPDEYAPRLGELRAPLGTWAVLGNHDWVNGGAGVRDGLERAGVRVLDNESERIDDPRGAFWLAGVGDWSTGHAQAGFAVRDVPADGLPVLAMTHDPEAFGGLPSRVALLVAGHMHGGQVRVPGLTELVVGGEYVRGVYAERGQSLVVTSGVGTSLLPVRLGVPPEVMIVEVQPASAVVDASP